ncbi:MAG: PP2C family protein-serine/threonine phosphatase [Desulfobacterales bacterium]|nr:PP2C family protein-serine/threonine phosphatase [Desulfobacterales bacterium]
MKKNRKEQTMEMNETDSCPREKIADLEKENRKLKKKIERFQKTIEITSRHSDVITEQLRKANAEINSLNVCLKEENLRMSAELDIARRLQQMVLPRKNESEQAENLEIACFMEPADEVGGDYYDILRHNDNIKICIGDVTGHGLESGVIMLMAQTAVRTLMIHGETNPVRFLDSLNKLLYNNIRRLEADKSMTFSMLDYENGKFRISGYHEEVIVVRSDGTVFTMETDGIWLGLEPDIVPYIDDTAYEISLQPGEGIVLYTDGVTEAINPNGELYDQERLCEAVSRNWDKSAEEIKLAVLEDVRSFIDTGTVDDDLTLMVLKQR